MNWIESLYIVSLKPSPRVCIKRQHASSLQAKHLLSTPRFLYLSSATFAMGNSLLSKIGRVNTISGDKHHERRKRRPSCFTAYNARTPSLSLSPSLPLSQATYYLNLTKFIWKFSVSWLLCVVCTYWWRLEWAEKLKNLVIISTITVLRTVFFLKKKTLEDEFTGVICQDSCVIFEQGRW